MKIARINPLTQQEVTKEIDVTEMQYNNWRHGMLIQEAMPNVNKADREFIMTGYTQEDWDLLFNSV